MIVISIESEVATLLMPLPTIDCNSALSRGHWTPFSVMPVVGPWRARTEIVVPIGTVRWRRPGP